MRALRTRFKEDIVTEFLPPFLGRPRSGEKNDKVVIFAGGMPGVPVSGTRLVEYFSKKGFWAFYPRYRGSWESGGQFLKISPEQDIIDILDELPRGFRSVWDGKMYKLKPVKIYVIGSSFGGPAAILASRDPRVTKAIAFSSVVDWREDSRVEPMDWLEQFVREGFGEAYRFSHKDWVRLSKGKLYSPVHHGKEIDGRKLLIIHAKDDEIVRYRPVAQFAKKTGVRLISLRRGGHLSFSMLMKPHWYRIFKAFLSK